MTTVLSPEKRAADRPAAGPRPLDAMRLIPSPRTARRVGHLLLAAFLLTPVALIFVPWQQAVPASGRVLAYDPSERQQTVEAPVDGRIARLHVREGDAVTRGQVLVSIQDPDPDLMRRLGEQKLAIQERQQAARARLEAFEKQIRQLEESQKAALAAAESRLQMARDRFLASEQGVTVARLARDLSRESHRMEATLWKDGLTSQIKLLQATQAMESRDAELERAQVTKDAAAREVDALRSDLEKVRNDTAAAISVATASWQSAMAELAGATRELADMEVRLARQATQEVTAPCDGTVQKVVANASNGGTLVRSGDPLLILVPEVKEKSELMAELHVNGNDAPLITELWASRRTGDETPEIKVRLQIEGWPAVQTVGWPSLAIGTFGGVVVFVDPHDDGRGRFRILVKPDPEEERVNPWPSGFTLRQGARVQGWVLLNEVTLGWEVWRRLNGFPQLVGTTKADEGEGKKPGKVKVPK